MNSAPASSSARAARAEMQPSWDSADCRASRFTRSVCRAGQGQHLAVGDQAARKLEEGFVDVGSTFPAETKSFEAVEPGEGAFDHPSVGAQAAPMRCAAAGDDGEDPAGPDPVAVDVVVVAAVGDDRLRLAARPPGPASDWWDAIGQGHELGDIVAVAAREDHGERGAVSVGDQVVLGACPSAVDWRRACLEPPFDALTWLESTTARDQSSRDAAFSSASNTCAAAGVPLPRSSPAVDASTSCQTRSPAPAAGVPTECRYAVRSRIPHSTCRSGTGLRPGYLNRLSRFGRSGSIRCHRSSDAIQGEAPMTRTAPRICRPDTATRADPPHCVGHSKA